MLDPAAPRWPDVRPGRGHYESFYLRAVHPTEPRGIWIRYTVTVPPGGSPEGQLWCTVFDRSTPTPRAVRVDAGEPTSDSKAWIRLGDSTFGSGEVVGSAGSARWSLRCITDQPPLWHLPKSWMYTARLPRTKLLSLSPSAVFDGSVEVDGETVEIDGWPGMVGHNWGEEHAEEWIWLSALGLPGRGPGSWLDVAIARVRLGPVTTPWIANGALSVDGERYQLGGLRRRVDVVPAEDHCHLRIPGSGATVIAWASAPEDAFVEWDYANPDGALHRVLNCSVADLRLRIDRPDTQPLVLTAPSRAAYEWGRSMHPLPTTRRPD
jgi:hypothetical protein